MQCADVAGADAEPSGDVKCGREVVVRDFPKGAWRIKEPAEGIFATIVNGQALYNEGKHTGALPGRVLRNTYYHANHA